MIEILSPAELTRAKGTGALVADILQTVKSRSTVGTNLLDIDRWTKAMIAEAGAQSCYVDYAPLDAGRLATTSARPSTTPYCTGGHTTTRLPTATC